MTTKTTIERLPDESAKAHRARVEYVTMGEARSLDALAQKYNKSRSLFARWSTQFDWQTTARAWDDQQAAALATLASEEYRASLTDYRKRYGEMGKGLWQAAAVLTRRLIKESATMELGPGALALAANAAKTAADLEALSLRIEGLLNEPRSE